MAAQIGSTRSKNEVVLRYARIMATKRRFYHTNLRSRLTKLGDKKSNTEKMIEQIFDLQTWAYNQKVHLTKLGNPKTNQYILSPIPCKEMFASG